MSRSAGIWTCPPNYKSVIRATLERNSADSIAFDGRENLFYSVDGLGNGHLGLLEAKDTLELTQDDDGFSEGKLLLKKHLQRERNPRLISEAKKRFVERNGRLFCEVCGVEFEEAYGDLGKILLRPIIRNRSQQWRRGKQISSRGLNSLRLLLYGKKKGEVSGSRR